MYYRRAWNPHGWLTADGCCWLSLGILLKIIREEEFKILWKYFKQIDLINSATVALHLGIGEYHIQYCNGYFALWKWNITIRNKGSNGTAWRVVTEQPKASISRSCVQVLVMLSAHYEYELLTFILATTAPTSLSLKSPLFEITECPSVILPLGTTWSESVKWPLNAVAETRARP